MLTTREAAERLGVPPSTLKTWLSSLPIEAPTDSHGRRRLDPDALAVLEQVKAMREDGQGYQTIRRVIRADGPGLAADGPGLDGGPTGDNRGPASFGQEAMMAAMLEQVSAVIRAETGLSEKFAAAARQVGRLEAENSMLREQIAAAQEKIHLLEAPPARPWWKRLTGR